MAGDVLVNGLAGFGGVKGLLGLLSCTTGLRGAITFAESAFIALATFSLGGVLGGRLG
jgi:hypothetical protein